MAWEERRPEEAIQTGPGLWTSGPSTTTVLIAIVLIAAIAVVRNKTLSFYLKYHAFTGIYMFFALLCIPILLLDPGNPKGTWLCRVLVNRIQVPLYGIRARARNLNNFPEGPMVIVCNHQSTLDCLGIVAVLPENGVVVMKKSLKYMGLFGLGAILAGSIFVDRGNKSNTPDTLRDAAEIIKKKKRQVFIFPEGTRKMKTDTSHTEPMLPFKKGGFNMAVLAQVPVVPVVFSSQKHLIDFEKHTLNSGEYTATVLPPVSTEGLTLDDVQDLSDKVRSMMIDCFLDQANSNGHRGS